MPRYKLVIEYDGTPFAGWQIQKDVVTVQGRLLEAVRAFSGEEGKPAGAGRTDTGVHACGQVAHLDLQKDWRAGKVRDALNAVLRPAPIAILSCEQVDKIFDARFSATGRQYFYRIINRRAPLTFDLDRAWIVHQKLDAAQMHVAAQCFVGYHDFTTFRSVKCQAKNALRTIDEISVQRLGEEIHMRVRARSFLHNQVRSFMGSLKYVGQGKWNGEELRRRLEAKDRHLCGPLAPSCGLYFEKVFYG